MRVFAIIATKGRAREMRVLLDCLARQTLPPEPTIVVGTCAADIEGLSDHALVVSGKAQLCVSPKTGLTSQRNFGLDALAAQGHFDPQKGRFFCAFFDDDYRMARDWLAQARARFEQGGIVGLTGCVLADGVRTGGLSEAEAEAYLRGATPPQAHFAGGAQETDTESVYGCNMAFADAVVRQIRFDEALPLYGWQEDRDYTGMALKTGRVIYFPGCKGVHLGVRGGRVSGVRFGYSQVANPVYLMKKGTMGYGIAFKFMFRALAGNTLLSFTRPKLVDYRGRLYGNLRALADVCLLRLHPRNLP